MEPVQILNVQYKVKTAWLPLFLNEQITLIFNPDEYSFRSQSAPMGAAFSEKQTGMKEAVLALWLSVACH